MKNFNKSLFIKLICVALFVCAIIAAVIILISETFIQNRDNYTGTESVDIYYSVNENCCSIIGQPRQKVKKGGDASPITLVPKLGYYFVGWVSATGDQNEVFDSDKLTRHDVNLQEDLWISAKFIGPVNGRVIFAAEKGGRIEGKLDQEVIYGGRGERVTAIPDEEYRFVKWSDGETEAVRENLSICTFCDNNSQIYAEFERYSRKFKYVYNEGVSETGETEVEINLDNMNSISLPVPKRQNCKFQGWYSDWHQEVQVADENGQIIVGKEWLGNDGFYNYATNPEGYLYAKWSTENKLPTYKILMVYVTEVHGDFLYLDESKEYVDLRVDYVMTEKHRKICNLITGFMSKYLNAIFNETVRFQVDEYFTTEPISEKEFGGPAGGWSGPDLKASNGVQETKEIIKNYDSVLTAFSLCGYENDFKLTGNVGGSADSNGKFATVVLDDALKCFEGSDIEDLIDYSSSYTRFEAWESCLDSYIHEFIHTVELQVEGMNDGIWMHSAMHYFSVKNGAGYPYKYNIYIPYLLNKFEVDNGEYWGIPYDFWLKFNN